jgi:hypothetical protein
LHLLLKLQSYLTKGLDVIIPLYASLALQYLHLGYTGKAGTLFAQALKQMKDCDPSTSTQLLWHINYAEYFARIGVLAKAKSHMSQAGDVYKRSFGTPKKWIGSSERVERILAVSRAGLVFSLISFEENELEKAIGHIDYTIRVLKTGITTLERSNKVAKASTRDFDPFSSVERPPVQQSKSKTIKFGPKLWNFKSVCTLFAVLRVGIFLGAIATRCPSGVSRICEERRILVPSSL